MPHTRRASSQGAPMKTIGDKLEPFKVTGVEPGFSEHEENGASAFEDITESSFPGKWKVIYFYPKDFTFSCPTPIVGCHNPAPASSQRHAARMGGSGDNEYVKLAWRREQAELDKLGHYQCSDLTGSLIDQLGVRDRSEGVAHRATFIVDPDNVIQHVSVNNVNVGRNPEEILRILDALQTEEPSPCNRRVGGDPLSLPHGGHGPSRLPAAPPRSRQCLPCGPGSPGPRWSWP